MTHLHTRKQRSMLWISTLVSVCLCRHNIFPLSLTHSFLIKFVLQLFNFHVNKFSYFFCGIFVRIFISVAVAKKVKKKLNFIASRISLRFFSLISSSIFLESLWVSARVKFLHRRQWGRRRRRKNWEKFLWINFNQVCVRDPLQS